MLKQICLIILTKKGIWIGSWVFHLVELNLESIYKSYNPINQFRNSVLMDCLRQLRKIVREEIDQDTTVYTGSIQKESTSSFLLSKPT